MLRGRRVSADEDERNELKKVNGSRYRFKGLKTGVGLNVYDAVGSDKGLLSLLLYTRSWTVVDALVLMEVRRGSGTIFC